MQTVGRAGEIGFGAVRRFDSEKERFDQENKMKARGWRVQSGSDGFSGLQGYGSFTPDQFDFSKVHFRLIDRHFLYSGKDAVTFKKLLNEARFLGEAIKFAKAKRAMATTQGAQRLINKMERDIIQGIDTLAERIHKLQAKAK